MARRIVLVRSSGPLAAAWESRSFAPAGSLLNIDVRVAGLEFDEGFHPVRVAGWLGGLPGAVPAAGYDYGMPGPIITYALRVDLADQDAADRLRRDRSRDVVGVFADPTVQTFAGSYCGSGPVGSARSVAGRLGVAALAGAQCTGKGVRLAIVDTGIDGSRIPVKGGWSPRPGYVPGSTQPDHGTMCAFDALIAAPRASVLDYALLQSSGETWTAFLSDAIAAFADLMDLLRREPGPLVVSNSWGLFDRSEDAPIGAPENYSANPDHPFNQITGSLVAAGADVFFAAGNCGADCPDGRCPAGDTGPGASIHGANSHPDVITVAAVTTTHRRLGYSSQGPGGLARRKPDLAAYSHFSGSGVYPADGGTSAACPVAAGAAAALRERLRPDKVSPARLKAVLQRTANDIDGDGWDFDLGYGVIDAAAAATAFKLAPAKKSPAKKPPAKKRPAKKPPARKRPAKKPPARKPPAREPSAKKPAPKKPVAKKRAPRKAAPRPRAQKKAPSGRR